MAARALRVLASNVHIVARSPLHVVARCCKRSPHRVPSRSRPPLSPAPTKPTRPQWFQSWHPTTPVAYALTVLALAALGVAHEALGSHRVQLARRQQRVAAAGGGGLVHAYAPIPAAGGAAGGLERAPVGARLVHR